MSTGKLYVVSTPIGNLGDLSERARQVLEAADVVACEDTRHSGRLMAHLGLKRPLISLHEHNEAQRLTGLLARLERGEVIALISDAGTPLVSDPGFLLVRAAAAAGHRVEAVPGPSAVLAALAISGLPPQPFTFLGFPPPKSGKRRTFLRRHAGLDHTLVLFESPHRLIASLGDMETELGDRPAVVARELTKLHEEVLRGELRDIAAEFRARERLKGEFVVVLGPPREARDPS